MKPGREDIERLLEKVTRTSSCWLFSGAHVKGYGQFRFKGKTYLAHRASYELFVGPIPEGMDLCHKCDVRNCVNPEHLFIGTRSDNMKDCVSKGRHKPSRWCADKTHCPKGHAYEGTNLVIEKSGYRKCRICKNQSRMRNYYQAAA